VTDALDSVFVAIDARDTQAFLDHLHADVDFVFGNAPEVQGQEALREVIDGFFAALGGIAHHLDRRWAVDDTVICHGQVTYTRQDGSQLTVPFANVFTYDNGLIRDYRIFVDNSALFSAA